MPSVSSALAYAKILGWRVIPEYRKVPAIRGGRGIRDATTDEATIRRWWMRYPDANIGAAAGVHWWALDVDPDKGGDRSLAELTARHGPLPRTVTQLSGGGGRHFLFQPADGLRNMSGLSKTGRGLGHGLDIRTSGTKLTVAPSIHHETGAMYEWAAGLGPRDVPIADAPAWLLELATPPEPAEVCAPGDIIEAGDWGEYPNYSRAALERACDVIASAPNGSQNAALNGEAYSIGRLIAGGSMPLREAREALIAAGMSMTAHDPKRPWTMDGVTRIVKRAIAEGARKPKIPSKR